jgi:hypothetical protein
MAWRATHRRLTNEQLLELHAQGVGCRELAQQSGISPRQMNLDLKRLGVVLRPPRPWFNEIDTDTKAYALGFIWADGTLAKKTVMIAVQERDVHILERLRDESGFGRIALFRKECVKEVAGRPNTHCQTMMDLRWHSQDMLKALKRYGLCENKMKVLPQAVLPDPQHMRAFVRGLVDGDGHVSFRSSGDVVLGFANHNESLIAAVANYFAQVTSPHRVKTERRTSGQRLIKQVVVTGFAAVDVARDLYLTDETTIALERKRTAARGFVEWAQGRRHAA